MRYLLCILVAMASVGAVHAQDGDTRLNLPSSPAFSILNFEPAAVLKPTTARSLAADVASAFDRNGKLLMNLGMEVSPYWMQSRPMLTREQYLHPGLLQLVKQSFSLSAATARDSANGQTKLGAGFRLKLLNGQPVATLAPAEQKLVHQESITNAIAIVRGSAGNGALKTREACIERMMTIVGSSVPGNEPPSSEEARRLRLLARQLAQEYTDDELMLFLDKLAQRQVASYDSLAHRVSELNYQRKGWIMEVAGATAFNASRGNDLERAGVWANLSNYVSPQDLVSLSTRYMWRHFNDSSTSNFDAGVSYLKQESTYNVSVEALARWYTTSLPAMDNLGQPIRVSDNRFTYRVAIQGSYVVTRGLSVNLSVGKGFEDAFASTSGFFSILGFNYSVFSKEYVKL